MTAAIQHRPSQQNICVHLWENLPSARPIPLLLLRASVISVVNLLPHPPEGFGTWVINLSITSSTRT